MTVDARVVSSEGTGVRVGRFWGVDGGRWRGRRGRCHCSGRSCRSRQSLPRLVPWEKTHLVVVAVQGAPPHSKTWKVGQRRQSGGIYESFPCRRLAISRAVGVGLSTCHDDNQ